MSETPPVSDTLAFKSVSKFMTVDVILAKESTTLMKAMELMITNKISGLPVVSDEGKLVGVYSEMDAILQAASKPLTSRIECQDVKLITCYPDTSFREALLIIIKNKLKRMPVVNVQRQVVGIVTRYDFMKAYINDFRRVQAPRLSPQKVAATKTAAPVTKARKRT